MSHEVIEHGTIKIIELVGVSQRSFEDAVEEVIKRTSKSIEGITGIEVCKFSAKIDKGSLVEYHASVKLAFIVK
jgi:flavin-binding protein dodecin